MIENAFYTPEVQGAYQLHSLGGFDLEEGGRIPDLRLAYATYGELNAAKDNAILIPTWFSGTHATWEQVYIGPGRALDPSRWFVVVVNQIGNGLCTSPHNADGDIAMSGFPHVRIGDDVRAQQQLAAELFGIGWSSAAPWVPSRPTSGRCGSPSGCCAPRPSPGPPRTPRTTSCSPRR